MNIFGLIDDSGNLVVRYTYDAWGSILSTTGTLASTLGVINPFRYKGYYYDSETGMYYCQTRYYVPQWCRWLSADSPKYLDVDSPKDINLFAYCGNNPVNYSDRSGHMPEWLANTLKIVGGVLIIAGCVVASIFTAGVASVIFAGAALGAIAGGVSAGISTVVSGGNITDFANSFLIGTVGGAISGAVAASPLGMWGQAGINAALSMGVYAGSQALGGGKITFGGLVINGVFGFATGLIGGDGWLAGQEQWPFLVSGGYGFILHAFGFLGPKALARLYGPAVGLGGASSGLYGKLSNYLNPDGYFWGW